MSQTKRQALFFLIILFPWLASTQINFQAHVIVDQTSNITANGANTSKLYDLDGDGDLDVLFTSWVDDKVGWYENTDGKGNFGVQKILSVTASTAIAAFAADLDGDGDLDILSAGGSISGSDGKIVWYKNLDGQGTFSFEQIVFSDGGRETEVTAGDIDGDGDMDVISGSFNGKVAWYENIDGQASFGTQQIITIAPVNVRNIVIYDLDGDDDLDLIASLSSSNPGQENLIEWYENVDGQGSFNEPKLITDLVNGVRFASVSDLDGDGDGDVLSASWWADHVAWYENIDGQGNFGDQQIINTIDNGMSVYAIDLDGDGDNDVVSASWLDETLGWYENVDGMGTFGPEQIISTEQDGLSEVVAGDIDGDGDNDVISASQADDKIIWYENSLLSSFSYHEFSNFSVGPNPTEGILEIRSATTIVRIEIYNLLGQLILENSNLSEIDLSIIKSGNYICRVTNDEGRFGVQKIIKK